MIHISTLNLHQSYNWIHYIKAAVNIFAENNNEQLFMDTIRLGIEARKESHKQIIKHRGKAKLTPEDVRAIRSSGLKQMELTAIYQVSQSAISNIKRHCTHTAIR